MGSDPQEYQEHLSRLLKSLESTYCLKKNSSGTGEYFHDDVSVARKILQNAETSDMFMFMWREKHELK